MTTREHGPVTFGRPACAARLDLPWVLDTGDLKRRHGDLHGALIVHEMRRVCAGCPVRTRCADAAADETGGWWAGSDRSRPSVHAPAAHQTSEQTAGQLALFDFHRTALNSPLDNWSA